MNCPRAPRGASPGSLTPSSPHPQASGHPQEEPSAGKPHARICEGEGECLGYSILHNVVRLALFVLAYNLGNFLRWLVLPPEMARRSLTTPRERLVKIGARLTRHARRLVLQTAEAAVPRGLFGQILTRIRRLSPVPTR